MSNNKPTSSQDHKASEKNSAKKNKSDKVEGGQRGKQVFGKKDRGLGRGLSALMADVNALAPPVDEAEAAESDTAKTSFRSPENENKSRGINTISIDQLVRNPDQPRRYFDPVLLSELTQSIKDKGVLQPILVRPVPDRSKVKEAGVSTTRPLYQIVAGERRWQASLKAGLTEMPVLIRALSDRDVLEIGVIENVQRADLNPIEEAMAYRTLIDQFGRTQHDVSSAIGKSRPHVANMLRLLTLPLRAQEALKTGEITTGHARAIVASPDPDLLVEHIISHKLTVRDAEDWVRRLKRQKDKPALNAVELLETKSADIRAVEVELQNSLGLSVDLRHKGPSGEIRLKYSSNEQLEMLLVKLKRL